MFNLTVAVYLSTEIIPTQVKQFQNQLHFNTNVFLMLFSIYIYYCCFFTHKNIALFNYFMCSVTIKVCYMTIICFNTMAKNQNCSDIWRYNYIIHFFCLWGPLLSVIVCSYSMSK